jgi:menaquinone-9 beta-reductase
MDADVAVVGSGPVGASAAMLLARAGREVVLLDKAVLPRDKPCGEGLMPSGVRVLSGLGIDTLAEGFPPVRAVRYRLEHGPSVRGELLQGPGCGVRRLQLDALLAARGAATTGVTLVTGCAVRGVAVRDDRVRLTTERGELYSRVLIGADGLRSSVAGVMGWARPPARRRPRHGLVGHLGIDAARMADEIVITLLESVEVYSAPSGVGEMLVAVLGPRGSLRGPGLTVTESYRALVEQAHPELKEAPLTGRVWGAGPFYTSPRRVAAGRVFLAGDAAGFLDPLTGDGISSGLAQAETLSRLLDSVDLRSGAVLEGAAASYRRWVARQWRRRRAITALALALTGSASLARRAMMGVTRRPAALQALLAVNDGSRGLLSLGPRDWAALAGF